MRLRERVAWVVLGLALVAPVVAWLHAVHHGWFGSGPLAADGINALGLAVAAAALALSWLTRSPAAVRLRPPAAVATVLAAALAALSILVYLDLGNVSFPYHRWEQFHYYLGARYFPELSYSRLYTCTAVAEAERFGRRSVAGRGFRDLATNAVLTADIALDRPEECKRHFSPERWTSFVADVAWFRQQSPTRAYWANMQQDHGFNPPPTWAIAGHALASLAPASARTQTRLALLDPLLLLGTLGLIGRAFGARVLWVAVVVWGCQFPARAAWTAGAFLRQDWLFCLVASVCLARRGRWLLAGIAIASAAALRLFPALLLAGPLLVAARHARGVRSLPRRHRRFLCGVFAAALFWFGLSTVLFGLDAWRAFARHIVVHRTAPLGNHVGLRALVSQTVAGRIARTVKPNDPDPYGAWAAGRWQAFAARRPLYLVLAGVLVAATIAASRRIRRLWQALATSTVLVVAALDLASYYCAFFVVLALLAAVSPAEEWLALGAVVASRAVNALPGLAENPDVRYWLQSTVFVSWAAAAPVVLVWGRGRRARISATRRAPGVPRRWMSSSPPCDRYPGDTGPAAERGDTRAAHRKR